MGIPQIVLIVLMSIMFGYFCGDARADENGIMRTEDRNTIIGYMVLSTALLCLLIWGGFF